MITLSECLIENRGRFLPTTDNIIMKGEGDGHRNFLTSENRKSGMDDKPMKRKMIFVMIMITAGLVYWLFQQTTEDLKVINAELFIFVCPSGGEIKISYDNGGNSADLFLEGKRYKLHRVISASGARYANEDETVIFWEHQGEAMVELDGKIMEKECRVKE